MKDPRLPKETLSVGPQAVLHNGLATGRYPWGFFSPPPPLHPKDRLLVEVRRYRVKKPKAKPSLIVAGSGVAK